MKTVGIIAEYNPFHNGHFYQLKEAKKKCNADYIIVVMSGDFVQRGEPAIIDKYTRCEMALLAGADLVIELPVCYATASAEYFAMGAVAILDSLHVDYICFGSESGDISPLMKAAEILLNESDSFKAIIREQCRLGVSYPTAQKYALSKELLNGFSDSSTIDSLLSSPNNILGIEYIKAIRKIASNIEPITIKRIGNSYHDTSLSNNTSLYASATALRLCLTNNENSYLQQFMPDYAVSILEKSLSDGYPLYLDDFSSQLFMKLLSLKETGYQDYFDINRTLSDKITKNLDHFTNISSFISDSLKSRDFTQVRLVRALCHILLDIKQKDISQYQYEFPHYIRILGFRKRLKEIFPYLSQSQAPLLTKLTKAPDFLSPIGLKMLRTDLFASNLYEQAAAQKKGRTIYNEYSRKLLIVD